MSESVPPDPMSYPCGLPSCPNMATKRCCRCRAIHYCTKQCSDSNWKNHKLDCQRMVAGGFRLEDMPGKGKGLVAAKVLNPGDVILTEEPLIVIQDGEPISQILQRLEELSDVEKSVVLGLYDPGDDAENDQYLVGINNEDHRKFIRITWANSIQLCGYPEFGIDGSGVYPTICRLNHSCAPNVVWTWLEKSWSKRTKQVRACRRIEEGDEICLSYIQQGTAFLQRAERLQRMRNWFPQCACAVCELTGEELEENERVRSELAVLHKSVREYCRVGRLGEAENAAMEKIRVMETVADQVVLKVPWALLDWCELSALLRARGIKEDEEEDREREETFRGRALKLATQLGDSYMYNYKKKCLRIARIATIGHTAT